MDFKLVLLLIVASAIQIIASPTKKNAKPATCSACHPTVKGKTNVHLVPHSHDDVGWLKTVDQYYYGSQTHNTYEGAGVQYIISAAVDALQNHPDRRYIQVETAFFWQWWQNQNDLVKEQVQNLVDTGRLEFINGAWSMNDEAAAHYHSIIDQYTWGLRRLNDSLGECARPKFSWQIDPFGHSREQASLLNQMGFMGLLVGRLDYRDKNRRIDDKDLDFIWKVSDSLDNSHFYTTTYPNGYIYESNFCFDVTCNDVPIYDDPNSPDFNLLDKMEKFSNLVENYKNWYQSSNILIPMGGDFTYQAAEINFSNSDKLVKAFKDHDNYNVIYSTPNCYARAVNEEINANNVKLNVKKDDFFPYASGTHSYWTGYFTSRPTSKRYERQANNILQSAKQLASLSKVNGKDVDESLVPLRQALGIMQHHDAITGTEKQNVANDYARILTIGIEKTQPALDNIQELLKKSSGSSINLGLSLCLLSNVSICENSSKDKFLVAIQNPLSRTINHYVRLPVNGTNFKVTGDEGNIEFNIVDTISNFEWITGEFDRNVNELVFLATDLPPLGIKVYYIEKLNGISPNYVPFKNLNAGDDLVFGTEKNQFTINELGRLSNIVVNGEAIDATQDILYYPGVNDQNGGDNDEHRASGAYVFRPTQSSAIPFAIGPLNVKVSRGTLVDEVWQEFNFNIHQIVRVYKSDNDNYIEFDWLIGDLQFSDINEGPEVITRYKTNLATNETFFTDSNGREQIKRKLNKRPDYEYEADDEPVAGNYYPITAKIVLKEENKEFTVLNDRAQGGSSLEDGVVEILVHRRLSHDDAFGVDEALNEVQYDRGLYARGQHWVTYGSSSNEKKSPASIARDIALRKRLAPLTLIGDATGTDLNSLDKIQKLINFKYEGLTKSLPENVAILTLEPWKDDTFILRLEHILEKDEDVEWSKPATIDLENLFTSFSINDIGETTLGANQWLSDFEDEEKFVWTTNDVTPTKNKKLDIDDNPLKITLNPMEIRTFIIKVASK